MESEDEVRQKTPVVQTVVQAVGIFHYITLYKTAFLPISITASHVSESTDSE